MVRIDPLASLLHTSTPPALACGMITCLRSHVPIRRHIRSTPLVDLRAHLRFRGPSQCCQRHSRSVQCTAASGGYEAVPAPTTVFQFSSAYNPNIAVVQFPEGFNPPLLSGSRALFLDRSGNVHSLYNKDRVITGQYWDQLAVLPAFVSEGPIAVLGLGAGTVAHILHKYWPERVMHGWELDQVVVQVCRDFMGLRELEERGAVVVHCANAFDEDATVEGGFAGILVDLFANAELLPELALESTWMQLQSRLRPGGRIIINLGPPPKDIDSLPYKTLAAMHAVFDGKVMCQVVATDDCNNAVAMTGDVPEPGWLDLVPKFLQEDADSWRTWMPALQF